MAGLIDKEIEEATLRHFKAARVKLMELAPYYSSATFALVPVVSRKVPTIGVDVHWRCYINPDFFCDLPILQAAGILAHEVNHLLRDHAGRRLDRDPHRWNVAGDAEINDGLNLPLPDDAILPGKLGMEEDHTAEWYYGDLDNGKAQEQGQDQGQGEKQEQTDGSSQETQDQGESQDDEAGDQGKDESQADGSDPQDGGQGQEQEEADSSSAGDSVQGDQNGRDGQDGQDGQDEQDGQESDEASDSSPASGTSENGAFANQSSDGAQAGAGTEKSDGPFGASDCGSGATGVAAPWEEDGQGYPGLGPGDVEIKRREVAREILKSRGTAPGGLVVWAETLLTPKVDWRRELAACVREGVALTKGYIEPTFTKRHRRASFYRPIIMPGSVTPEPTIAVVIDTSGSMSNTELARAEAETQAILRQISAGLATVVTCDVEAVTSQVRHGQRVAMHGRGGTDMRVGIQAAMESKPRPNIVVLVTDGYTPWPEEPLRGANLIVVTTDEPGPAWAKTIRVS